MTNAKRIFDTIGVVAAGAAIAQQAYETLGPHLSRAGLGAMLPRCVATLPTRIGNAACGFMASPDAPAQRAQRRPAPRRRVDAPAIVPTPRPQARSQRSPALQRA